MSRADARDAHLSAVFIQYWHHHGSKVASKATVRRALEIILETVGGDPTIAEFGPRPQQKLIADLMQRYPPPSGYAKRVFGVFKAAVLWAWQHELITHHPPFAKSPPEGEARDRVLTVAELARLWDASRDWPHLQAFLMVCMGTMCRPGAALELTAFRCDLDSGTVDLNPPGRPRTKKRRPIIPMANALRPWVAAAQGHIVTYNGKPIREIKGTFRKARGEAGFGPDVVPITLRHTMASELMRRGVPDVMISAFMGHTKTIVRTTDRYAKFSPTWLLDAREAIDSVITEMARLAGRAIVPETPVRSTYVPLQKSSGPENPDLFGAGEAIRTPDPHLGKVMLYP
jgi:integrase